MTFAVRTLQGGGAPVVLFNRQIEEFGGADCYAGYQLASNGDENFAESQGSLQWSDSGNNWLRSGSSAGYWVNVSASGATLAAGSSATGSWLQLSTTRSWYLSDLIGANKLTTLTVQVASDSGGSNVVASCTVTLEVEKAI